MHWLCYVSGIKNMYGFFFKITDILGRIIIFWISTVQIWTLDSTLWFTYVQN